MGEWREVKKKPWSPCDGCEVGFGSISQKEENGKLYTKTDDCHETCERYKAWVKGEIKCRQT